MENIGDLDGFTPRAGSKQCVSLNTLLYMEMPLFFVAILTSQVATLQSVKVLSLVDDFVKIVIHHSVSRVSCQISQWL